MKPSKYPFLNFWSLPHADPYEPPLFLESADGVEFLVTTRAALLSPHLAQLLQPVLIHSAPLAHLENHSAPLDYPLAPLEIPTSTLRGPRKKAKIHSHTYCSSVGGGGNNSSGAQFYEAKQVSESRIKFTHVRSALLYSIIKCMYHILLHVPVSLENFNTEASKYSLQEIINTFQDTQSYNLPWIKKFF